MENAGLWTAVDVRESGNWKIRMLTAFRVPGGDREINSPVVAPPAQMAGAP